MPMNCPQPLPAKSAPAPNCEGPIDRPSWLSELSAQCTTWESFQDLRPSFRSMTTGCSEPPWEVEGWRPSAPGCCSSAGARPRSPSTEADSAGSGDCDELERQRPEDKYASEPALCATTDDDDEYPPEITIYAATDDEGEPQVKAAWELWPVQQPVPQPRRHSVHAVPRLGEESGAARAAGCGEAPGRWSASPGAADAHWPQSPGLPPTTVRRPPGFHQPNPGQVTTLVVRNVPALTTQKTFLDEVNRSGFAGVYDFAYLPRAFADGRGKGHGFINFVTPEAAASFRAQWHRSQRLGAKGEAGSLNVSTAAAQGYEANVRKWTVGRLGRVKNPEFLPFIKAR